MSLYQKRFTKFLSEQDDENLDAEMTDQEAMASTLDPETSPEDFDVDVPASGQGAIGAQSKQMFDELNGWIEEFCGVKPENDAKAFVELSNELVESYYYVRENNSFYETKSGKFVSQDKMNAWWKHTTGKENMSNLLLKSPQFKKVVTYLTHAGMKPGIVQINFGDIPGVDPGEYLNVYTPSTIVAEKGDVSKLNEYYEWFLGKDNW